MAEGRDRCARRNIRRMTKRIRSRLKREIPRNFLKDWREFRDYSLDDVADRLDAMFEAEISTASLSRYENSKQPIGLDVLVMMAEVLRTTPESLICRPPHVEAGVVEVWSDIAPEDQPQALQVLQTFTRARKAGFG